MMRIEMITAGLRDQLLSSLHGWLKVEGDAILIMEEARATADKARDEIFWWSVAERDKLIRLRRKYGLTKYVC